MQSIGCMVCCKKHLLGPNWTNNIRHHMVALHLCTLWLTVSVVWLWQFASVEEVAGWEVSVSHSISAGTCRTLSEAFFHHLVSGRLSGPCPSTSRPSAWGILLPFLSTHGLELIIDEIQAILRIVMRWLLWWAASLPRSWSWDSLQWLRILTDSHLL